MFVPAYTPVLNGAEGCFSNIRRVHNSLKLENILQNLNKKNTVTMKEAIRSIEPDKFKAHCKESFRRWRLNSFDNVIEENRIDSDLLEKRGRIGRALKKVRPKKDRKEARRIPLLGTLNDFNA